MNPPTYVIAFLFTSAVFGALGEAQSHSARSQRHLLISSIQNVDVAADGAKIIETCELSNTPKRSGEIRKVSRLRGKAISMPKPAYPAEAKARKAQAQLKWLLSSTRTDESCGQRRSRDIPYYKMSREEQPVERVTRRHNFLVAQ